MSPADVMMVMRRLEALAFEAGAEEGPEGNEPAYRLWQQSVQARTAVAALLTREAALVAERDALAAEVGALVSARDAYRTMLQQAEEDVKALRLDADRWRVARMLIPVEAIDAEDSERADAGEWLAEEKSVKSDAAIDLLREHIARASADEKDAARAEVEHG